MSPAVLLGLAKETVLELPVQGEMAVRMSTEVASAWFYLETHEGLYFFNNKKYFRFILCV